MDSLERPAWNPERRCTATNRAGERCARQPIPGAHVCVLHGGKAPQVQQSARMRLLAGADLAIDYLLNLLTPKPPCEHCGRSDADRDPVVVRACQLVLDRAGYHPSVTVVQAPTPRDEFDDMTHDEQLEHAQATIDRCQRLVDLLRDEEAARLLPAATDGELIDDAGFEIGDDEKPRLIPSQELTIADEVSETPKENEETTEDD